MTWPIENYSINEIFLDEKNIRLPQSQKSQSEIIHELFTYEDAFDIVRSISKSGLYTHELPIVTKEDGKLIVVEGNRRIAAIKAINEPDIVPSYSDKIKALNINNITKVSASLAHSREDAMPVIAKIHTTTSRKTWKPLRQAYFYKNELDKGITIEDLIREYPEVRVIDFIKQLDMYYLAKAISYDDDIAAIVHDERKFPITNLERMYLDSNISTFLGIGFDEYGRVKGKIDFDEFKKPYKKLVEDVATKKIDSRRYNNEEQRKEYINKTLKVSFQPDKSKKGSFTVDVVLEQKFEKKPLQEELKQPKFKSSPKLVGLIPPYVECTLRSSSLKALYKELREISVKDFPNATHDLLRSFLECSLVYYLKKTKEYPKLQKSPRHTPKLGEMLTHISSDQCTSIQDENIKQVVKQIKQEYDSPYSLERMNMTNHNENWVSSEADVRAAWSKIEELMKYILNPIKNESNS